MQRIILTLALLVILVRPLRAVDIVVNSIPGDARFVDYAAADWKGATIVPDALQEIGDAVSSATEDVKPVAAGAGGDLIVLISPANGVLVPQRVVQEKLRLRKNDPILVAVFYKMKSGRKASSEESAIRFTTVEVAKAEGASVNMKIDQVANTSGATLSYWVYMNLPRFVAEAASKHLDTITIESSRDADCEEVWLPGCDTPLLISKSNPLINCSFY